ncbi:MAG: SGNH/GDSL hydrolase family protein [Deltaproteobacteria bacterium]|nr:SGNH/GDSL hydrolase family protein [Deltaproteobacteria bacterium]
MIREPNIFRTTGLRHRRLVSALVFLTSLAVAAVAAEVLLRHRVARQAREVWRAGGLLPRPYPGVEYGLAPCPRCDVPVSSLGFRGGEVSREKEPGVYRIAVLGDSATFGVGVSAETDTVPGRLRELLASREGRFEVINAGGPGYNIRQIFAMLKETVLPLDPDLVVYNFFANDLDNTVYEHRRLGGIDTLVFKTFDGPDGAPIPGVPDGLHLWLNDRSFLYRYLNYAGYSLRDRLKGSRGGTPYWRPNIAHISRMADVLGARGTEFVVSMENFSRCAHFFSPGDPVSTRGGPRDCLTPRKILDAVAAECASRGIPVVDLQPALRDVPLDSLVADDIDHYTAAGNPRMAEELFRFLDDRILPRR